MNIQVITSFNKTYYELIGKDSLKTWMKFWPEELSLTCFVEEFSLPEQERLIQISFDQFDNEYYKIQKSKIGGQARKFSKKAWSFIHAMENIEADRIIWLDADVLTVKTIPLDLIKSLLPDHVLSTHMGVTYDTKKDGTPGRWFVPETGFFAINKHHPSFENFKSEYRRRYVELDDTDLRRFYDNDVYGSVFESLSVEGLDLCGDLEKKYKTPLKRTVLGDYLQHYKAKHSKASYVSD
jgi:hypothetical protein